MLSDVKVEFNDVWVSVRRWGLVSWALRYSMIGAILIPYNKSAASNLGMDPFPLSFIDLEDFVV